MLTPPAAQPRARAWLRGVTIQEFETELARVHACMRERGISPPEPNAYWAAPASGATEGATMGQPR